MSDYPKHNHCLLCGQARPGSLKGYEAAYLVRCEKCRFVFSERIPTADELKNHYTENYSRNDYLSPITIKRYHEILDRFEPFRKNNRLIDVGCGIGYFLSVAKERGWEVYGTEYTDNAVAICRSKGFTMHQGKLNPQNYGDEFFDVVTSFEVLEHINNPTEEIANFHRIVRKGGLVYFTTPNFNALSRFIAKEKWTIIEWPEHLLYFTGRTITKLFLQAGFKKWSLQSTGFSVTRHQIVSGEKEQPYIAADNADEKLRNKMETNPLLGFLKKTINTLFTLLGMGDTLKGYFIKN